MHSLSLLLIEDNLAIARQLGEFFNGLDWQLEHAASGQQGLSLALANIYDVVLLDLNLPDMDGIDVCRKIKQGATVDLPILMLTARDTFANKAQGFGEGADDYLVKPYDLRELSLRCEALARRRQLHSHHLITIGELTIDRRKREATRQGQPLPLTRIGFEILRALAEAYPQTLSRSQLIAQIWQQDPPDSDALRSHIYSLRNTLDKPFDKPMLKTVVNVGFRLEADADV
ncbi:MAG TPA: response regulator transcription factor [Cellvibrionaceae bacterium]